MNAANLIASLVSDAGTKGVDVADCLALCSMFSLTETEIADGLATLVAEGYRAQEGRLYNS